MRTDKHPDPTRGLGSEASRTEGVRGDGGVTMKQGGWESWVQPPRGGRRPPRSVLTRLASVCLPQGLLVSERRALLETAL